MTMEINPVLRRAVRSALLGGGAFAAALAGHSNPAQAQEAPATANAAAGTANLEEVVVTGSRIKTPALESISPITSVSAEDVKATGVTRVVDLLNALPQVVADQGSGLSMGSTGVATINLRGLGPQRTLVLINGRRLMGGDPGAGGAASTNLGYASAADVNQIPTALIERVDVLTGGASSTYGADAVAGVVNFIMNDHFEGVRLDVNGGIYNHDNHNNFINPLLAKRHFPTVTGSNWDGSNKDLTLIMGHNFADGAGNFEGYLGYRREAPITADHRDHAACVLQEAGPNYQCGGSSNSAPTVIGGSQVCDPAFGCTSGAAGDIVNKYARYNYAATHYLQRIDERYTAGFFGHLKFNDHVEAYTEFMFMDDETRGNYAPAGLFFGSGFGIAGGLRDGNWLTNCGSGGYGNAGMNPYLTQNEFTAICQPGGLAAVDPNTGLPLPGPQAGDVQLSMARRNVEGGPREDEYSHTTWRGVFGARGEITADWTYDASFTFGRTRFTDSHQNDTSSAKMQDAMLAVRNAQGQIVCRSGNAGCVPWNIWNPAIPVSKDALAYFTVPGLLQGQSAEDIFTGFVSGDLTKQGIKLPTAEEGLKLVLGTEYRRDTDIFQPDAALQNADLAGLGSPITGFNVASHVWEGFTEARLPLATNKPFAKSLDLEAGYRYSAYTAGFDTNTYKIGLTWSPISDVRLRASFNRSVRVPNLAELYKAPYVGLDGGQDFCGTTGSGSYTGGYTAAKCRATGLPIGLFPAKGSPAGQYNGKIGGNNQLKPEVAKTTVVGVVLTPSFLPSFSATIDYSDIKMTGTITSYGSSLIQTNCLNVGGFWCNPNPAQGQPGIHRDPNGTLWASPQGYVIDPLINLGGLENKSLDVSLQNHADLGRFGRLRARLDGTYLLKLEYAPGGGITPYDCAGFFGPSCAPVTPKWRHRLSADWDTPLAGLSAGATWRFFGSAENTRLHADKPDFSGGLTNPADSHIPTISYLDLRVSYLWNKATFMVGVNNVLDKDPPLFDTVATGGNSSYAESNTYASTYDMNGRYLFARVTIDF
jgi:iron complex outermembrane receptor protein